MTTTRDGNKSHPTSLATDLDGTLIPLAGSPDHHESLTLLTDLLKRREMSLAFVTGRHFASVQNAITEFELPLPDWILCDVGTSAYEHCGDGEFRQIDRYTQTLLEITNGADKESLLKLGAVIPNLRLQEPEKQSRFKTSFCASPESLDDVVAELNDRLIAMTAPYQIISSIDPFTNGGLIDLLPTGVSKAFALEWLCQQQNVTRRCLIFAGDSGNDLAAFNAGYNTVIVGNAAASLVNQVQEAHRSAGWSDRLYHASQHATTGVLEGVQHFLRSAADEPDCD